MAKPNRLNPREHYLILTKTSSAPLGRDVEYFDYNQNPEYVKLQEAAKSGELAKVHPGIEVRLTKRAENFHDPDMVTQECIKYFTDTDGFIWIPEHDVVAAQRLFKQLKAIDREVEVSGLGLPIPEEKAPAPFTDAAGRTRLRDKLLNQHKPKKEAQ